jgi:hypothetical protein
VAGLTVTSIKAPPVEEGTRQALNTCAGIAVGAAPVEATRAIDAPPQQRMAAAPSTIQLRDARTNGAEPVIAILPARGAGLRQDQ